VYGVQALRVSALEYRWQRPEGVGQVLGFANLDVLRPAIQARICEEMRRAAPGPQLSRTWGTTEDSRG
jgi:hypothetical protein